MDRTLRAALLAAFIGFAAVAGTLVFLGVPWEGSMIAGLVAGALGGLLIWAAGRRADSFHTTDTVTPVEPGFPGPPEHDDLPDDGPTDGPTDGPADDVTDAGTPSPEDRAESDDRDEA